MMFLRENCLLEVFFFAVIRFNIEMWTLEAIGQCLTYQSMLGALVCLTTHALILEHLSFYVHVFTCICAFSFN